MKTNVMVANDYNELSVGWMPKHLLKASYIV